MLSIGRQGQLYGKIQAAYQTAESLAASNAIRHVNVTMPYDNKNRETVVEKKTSPGHAVSQRADRRKSAEFALEAFLRMGGVVNTAPELDPVLVAAFGTKTNVTLSTTVASGGTLTGATLTSAGTAAVGDGIMLTCPDGKKRIRRLATVVGAVVTWSPALPAGQVPANGSTVKCSITYKLTTANVQALTLAHYLKKTDQSAGLKRAIIGAGVDKFAIELDANGEPKITASGMGREVISGASVQAQPGGFTTVGGLPPSGLIGEMLIGGVAMKFVKFKADVSNGLYWRRDEFGDNGAVEMFRADRLAVNLSINCHAEDEATLYNLAEAGTNAGLHIQGGDTEGNMFALWAPQAEFKVPGQGDGDGVVDWDYTGMALESVDGANDQIALALF